MDDAAAMTFWITFAGGLLALDLLAWGVTSLISFFRRIVQ